MSATERGKGAQTEAVSKGKILGIFLITGPLWQPGALALTEKGIPPSRGFVLTQFGHPESSQVVSDLTSETFYQLDGQNGPRDLLGQRELSLTQVVMWVDQEFFRYWQEHPSLLSLSLEEESSLLGVRHRTYGVQYRGIPIHGSSLRVHESDNQGIVMVRWNLPRPQIMEEQSHTPDVGIVDAFLKFRGDPIRTSLDGPLSIEPVYLSDAKTLIPAWSVKAQHRLGHMTRIYLHGTLGTVLAEEHESFELTTAGSVSVFDKNPQDGKMVETNMPHLSPTGYLDSKFFSVYGPKEEASGGASKETSTNSGPQYAPFRARIQNNSFTYSAFKAQDSLAFDQVQTYFYAMRSLQWLWDKFGLDPLPQKNFLSIYVGGSVGGRFDQALYLPLDEGSSVFIAKNEKLGNLARDRDVISHELAHHIIYRGIKTAGGESGVIHEGTADYLAYVQSNDPYLGESIVPGAPYLRTALVEPQGSFDKLTPKMSNHAKGQIWSALLWDLGERAGHERVLQWIGGMIRYVGPRAGIHDALRGLLRADRDLVAAVVEGESTQASTADLRLFSGGTESRECLILERGLHWGFGKYLRDFATLDCGIDWPEEIFQDSTSANTKSKRDSILLEKTKICGAVTGHLQGSAHVPWISKFLMIVTMGIPMIVALSRSFYSIKFMAKE